MALPVISVIAAVFELIKPVPAFWGQPGDEVTQAWRNRDRAWVLECNVGPHIKCPRAFPLGTSRGIRNVLMLHPV